MMTEAMEHASFSTFPFALELIIITINETNMMPVLSLYDHFLQIGSLILLGIDKLKPGMLRSNELT